MIRWSRQLDHGWVPVAPSVSPIGSTSAASSARRSASAAGTSANDSCLPVFTSTSDAISSPTRFGSRIVPFAAACTSSKRFDEVERDRVEERELLLDRDGEVLGGVEALARVGEDLLVSGTEGHGSGRLVHVPVRKPDTATALR